MAEPPAASGEGGGERSGRTRQRRDTGKPPRRKSKDGRSKERRRSKDRHGSRERRRSRDGRRERKDRHGSRERKSSKSPRPKDRERRSSRHKSRDGTKQRHASLGKPPGKMKKQKSRDRLNKGKLAEKYVIKEKLGKGNFAVVRRVVRKTDQKQFAAKIISKKHLSQEELKDLLDETTVLERLDHPNIVQLGSVIDTPRHLYIVLELLTGGELFDRIVKKGHFGEPEAAGIMRQLAEAIEYMHGAGVVHRDLKPENLIYSSPADDALLKITDFGLAKVFKDAQDASSSHPVTAKVLQTACGTPGYVAPEILRQQGYDNGVDMWSCGVILYILLCGYPPFHADNVKQLYRKIKKGDYSFPPRDWQHVSPDAIQTVKGLLEVNPRKRLSATDLKHNKWVCNAAARSPRAVDGDRAQHFQRRIANMMHKRRLRRGVELIITLNRMISNAGLTEEAHRQRAEFRVRLKRYKEKLKRDNQKARRVAEQTGTVPVGLYMGDDTPPIDYSKV